MPSIIKFSLILPALFLAACATTHPGNYGQSLNSPAKLPLKISAENIDRNDNGSFQLIEITLENTEDAWLRLEKTEVVIKDPAESKVSVVLGQDLKDWAEAEKFKQKMDEHNKMLAQSGILAAGAVAAIAGDKDSNLAKAGTLILIGTSAWVVNDVINASLKDTQSLKIPENHLYRPANIPGHLFIRRWVLINKPSKKVVSKLVLAFKTIEGETDTYEISL